MAFCRTFGRTFVKHLVDCCLTAVRLSVQRLDGLCTNSGWPFVERLDGLWFDKLDGSLAPLLTLLLRASWQGCLAPGWIEQIGAPVVLFCSAFGASSELRRGALSMLCCSCSSLCCSRSVLLYSLCSIVRMLFGWLSMAQLRRFSYQSLCVHGRLAHAACHCLFSLM